MNANREDRLTEFYNALGFQRGIAFTEEDRREMPDSLPAAVYVEDIHKDGEINPRTRLLRAIVRNHSADRYFFTGMRGSGKTTELLKLKAELEGKGFVAFYADLSEFLPENEPVKIGDFMLLLVSVLADRVKDRYGSDFSKESFFTEFIAFLNSEIKVEGLEWSADTFLGKIGIKGKLKQNQTVRQKLQQVAEGRLDQLLNAVNRLIDDIVAWVKRGSSTTRVIYLVDSVERLRGLGEKQSKEVFDSLEHLFSTHADNLRFSTLSVVYSVPPYLRAVVGASESNLMCSLPAIRIFKNPLSVANESTPEESQATAEVVSEDVEKMMALVKACCADSAIYPASVAKMMAVVNARFSGWQEFFTPADLVRLVKDSGGDLREFFLLLRACLSMVDGDDDSKFPIPPAIIEQAEKERRNQFGMIPQAEMDWLKRVMERHDHGKLKDEETPTLAYLLDGKLMFQYRNGSNWYDVHPLLREQVKHHGANAAPAS